MPRSSVVMLATLLAVGTTVACSEGGFGSDPDTGGVVDPDTGGGPGGDDADAGIDEDGGMSTTDADTSTTTADGGDTSTGPSGSKTEAFTNCGAAGVSQGGGVRAIQCYGPSVSSGEEPTGGGVRWQPGAFRIITE